MIAGRVSLPFSLPLDQSVIAEKRSQILQELLSKDAGFRTVPVTSIHLTTLKTMLSLYDTQFFNGFLSKKLETLSLSMSSRLTSAAGKFICTKDAFRRIKSAEIRMSSDFLFRLTQGSFTLNGLHAQTPQEAFLIVFEHELCHAAETALFGETGHSPRFLSLANGLFGHTATRHSLPTRKAEAAKEGIRVGSSASFLYQGKTLTGVITYVGKTATVMVPSPAGVYRDKRGRRYEKYSVPISRLEIIR